MADFDHIDPEFSVFGGHFVQFWASFNPPRVLPKLITVYIRNVRELGLPADRADQVGRLAVELGRSQQVGVRVAHIRQRRMAGPDRGERRPPGQAVVHY